MTLLISLLLAFFGATYCGGVQAADLITARAVLEDASGTLKIDEVARAELTPIGPMLTKGYTGAVYWLRITVVPPAQPGPVVLRTRPTFLDDVRLYEPDPASPGAWITRVTGDRHSYNSRDSVAITTGFVVHPQKASTYYLRLQTTSSSMLNVQALSLREAQFKDLQLDIFAVFYLAFMTAMLFWAISDYAVHRQTVTLFFVLQQLVYEIYTLAYMGYLAPFVPADAPLLADKLTSLLTVAIVVMAIVFHRSVLQLYKPSRWLLHFLDGLVAVSLLNLAAVVLGYARLPLSINATLALLLAPLLLTTAINARQEGSPSLQVVRGIYAIFMLSLVATLLPLLGLVQATEWNLFALLIHGLIGSVLMFAILYLRSLQMQKLGQATQTNLQLAQQQLRLERAQKDEQGRFILMLTHELKTPIAVVRMALDALRVQGPLKTRADQALHDMNQIVERCQQVEQLEQHGFSLSTEPCQLDEMLLTLQDSSEAPERIRLHIEPMPPFLTDPPLLRIVMDNLLNNAVKYAAPATPITVHAVPARQKGRAGVRVSVCNQPGVAGVPDAARVFDKYYRSAGAHQKTGSGLGLYLVRSIATLLGGEVHMSLLPMTCDDAEGQAADSLCFTVWIPY